MIKRENIKLKKVLILLLLWPLFSYSQVNLKVYLTGFIGTGNLKSNEIETYGNNLQNEFKNIRVQNKPIGLSFQYSSLGKRKINLTTFGSFTLGAGMSKYSHPATYPFLVDDKDVESLNVYFSAKFGPQLNYISPDKNWLIGLRYFNWYNEDGLRNFYELPDDGAAIGIYSAFKQFGLEFNYAPKGLPGLLVINKSNISQAEFRYQFKKKLKNENTSLLMGIRWEHSSFKNIEHDHFFGSGQAIGKTNLISLLFGFGFGNKQEVTVKP